MDARTCPNCHQAAQGNFCPNCGQQQYATPLDSRILVKFFLDLLEFNTAFFRTLFLLYLRPRVLIGEFLSGRTLIFVNPFRFLALILAVIALAYLIRLPGSEISEWSILTSIAVLLSLVYTFAFNFILFGSVYRPTELVLITTFQLSAFGFLIFLMGQLARWVVPLQQLGLVGSVVFLLYASWFFKSVFGRGWWKTTMTALTYLVGLIGVAYIALPGGA